MILLDRDDASIDAAALHGGDATTLLACRDDSIHDSIQTLCADLAGAIPGPVRKRIRVQLHFHAPVDESLRERAIGKNALASTLADFYSIKTIEIGPA
jgi:hypothetical protein